MEYSSMTFQFSIRCLWVSVMKVTSMHDLETPLLYTLSKVGSELLLHTAKLTEAMRSIRARSLLSSRGSPHSGDFALKSPEIMVGQLSLLRHVSSLFRKSSYNMYSAAFLDGDQ